MTIAPESTSVMTDRERLAAILYTHPLMQSDAIVVLCGEDCGPRLTMAFNLWRSQAGEGIIVSGGKHDAPRWMGAEDARRDLLSKGVAPDRIIVEAESQHTREQAERVLDIAAEREWKRLMLVASSYHIPRAFLTFLKVLDERGVSDVRLIPAPVPARWTVGPEGMDTTRLALLDTEAQKIDEYSAHVATVARGLDVLRAWEAA